MTQQAVSAPSIAVSGSMPTGGRWGWYRDHEGREYRRVSTLVKEVETDTYNLDVWKLRQVAEGLAMRDDLVFALKAMGRPPVEGWSKEQKTEINKIVDTAMEVAKTGKGDGAKVGTGVHTLTERLDRGEPLEQVAAGLPAEYGSTVRAYALLVELNGWQTVEIERTVVCEELEVAGTFDRVEYVPGLAALLGPGRCQYDDGVHVHPTDGELPVIADVKTEGEPWRNGLHIGPQLAIYSRARQMWRPTGGTHPVTMRNGDVVQMPNGEYVPMPCVRQDVAVVMHLREGSARPYFVNLAEGWEAAEAAYAQINRKSRAGRKLGAAGAWFVPMPNIVEPRPAQTLVEHAAAERYADPNRPSYAVGDTVTVGGIEFTKHAEIPVPGEQVAVRDETTGLVTWQTTTPNGDASDLRVKLIAAIWKAQTVDALAVLWKMAQDRSVPWVGPVAQAGDARRRIIECPQRALHGGGALKCACGWVPAVAP